MDEASFVRFGDLPTEIRLRIWYVNLPLNWRVCKGPNITLMGKAGERALTLSAFLELALLSV